MTACAHPAMEDGWEDKNVRVTSKFERSRLTLRPRPLPSVAGRCAIKRRPAPLTYKLGIRELMDQLEQKLLKRYLALKERPAKLREIVRPHFVLNAILFVPMFIAALVIFYFGVREAAYIVLGMWLGMFVADIRHGKIFIKLWPQLKQYLDWDKIEKRMNEQNKS